MRIKGSSGFTITDLIVGMMIIAVAIVGIMYAEQAYIQNADRVELGVRGVSLGNAVMNTIRMHRYDENTSSPWSSSLGTDSGESAPTNYDDVDDYAGATWNFSAEGYPGFSVNTRVFYIDIETSWLDSVGGPTDFKRIIVTIGLGIAGAIVGGFISTFLGFGSVSGFNIPSLIIAVIGALVLLIGYRMIKRRS